MNKITKNSLELAAQCWCDEDTSSIEMNPPLALAFAKRLDAKDARIAELEKQLKPNIFWPDECEEGFSTEHDAIESMIEEMNAKVGSVFTLGRAATLLSQDYIITSYSEAGAFEWEEIKDESN